MSLQDWLKFGWLKEHKTSRQEIADLFAVADRDLKACQTTGLIPDWRFNIAYNAALQLASADYERADTISETEAEEMRRLAETLRSGVEAWVRKHYPQLAP